MGNLNSINEMHDQAMIDHFINHIGERVICFMPSYPFMFIGGIKAVLGDVVKIDVETTHFAQLEKRDWYIHIHNIEVFYIEREGEIEIPKLDDFC
ncbi:hypothetical protein [Jeotgalibacillus soli]|uniref:Uncharacterized protein n=1 Tax=Jeotgalibacillus soli TaxID=889306 RepID=A0A0C2RP43_9BACL|nr:hypothetical protein [Jeotgalibacillus soli]KIL52000.1 hypothetical protein KP78_03700 [Jeotgalibacillus soli]